MKYTPESCARALYSIGVERPRDFVAATHSLFAILKKRGLQRLLPKISRSFEKISIATAGGRIVDVVSALALGDRQKKNILAELRKEDKVYFTERPELHAGVKIVFNEEWMIDATLESRLQSLFGNKI